MRERLTLPPADEVVEYLFKPRSVAFVDRDFRLMMWINQAHVLMLVRQGILTLAVGQSLIRALRELEQAGTAGFTLDPRLEDLYFNLEHALIERVGMDVGGRMHTGRSRNDLGATMHRLAVREALVDFLELQFGLHACLLDKAAEHTDTVMPGYTHLQPAQPTTFGHYLASVALALARDAERLLDVYPRLNVNPLGACAFAGTGFPIDRAMTAQWLGFDGIVESTLDAVASRDYVTELLAAMAIMGVTLSRLAQDLYLWCSGEWGTVEVADDVAMTSSIMPQKKNPITLEHIKAKAGHLLGALTSTLAVQKGVNFMHCRDMGEAVAPLWEALQQAQGVVHLTRRTVLGLRVNKARMLERATQDFSTATELADVLVREKGLPFRVAHGIVASLVTRVLQEGLPWHTVTSTMIDECARQAIGQALLLSVEQVDRALDPLRNLAGKHAAGSPSAPETERLISRARDQLARQQRMVAAWQARHQQGRQALDRELAAQQLT
jgi:argininosuccinate lyase